MLHRVIAPLALGWLIAACSDGEASAPTIVSSPTVAATTGSVTIEGFSFKPQELSVSAGTTVSWTNEDSTAHTVTSDDDGFVGGSLAEGETLSAEFSNAGTYGYHCTIHPAMTATVTVTG